MFCKNCGAEIKDEGNFCIKCGAKTNGIEKEKNLKTSKPSKGKALTKILFVIVIVIGVFVLLVLNSLRTSQIPPSYTTQSYNAPAANSEPAQLPNSEAGSKLVKSSQRQKSSFTADNIQILNAGFRWIRGYGNEDLDYTCNFYCKCSSNPSLGPTDNCYIKDLEYQGLYASFNLKIPNDYIDPPGTICDPDCKDDVHCNIIVDGDTSKNDMGDYTSNGQYIITTLSGSDFTKSHTLNLCCDSVCVSKNIDPYCQCSSTLGAQETTTTLPVVNAQFLVCGPSSGLGFISSDGFTLEYRSYKFKIDHIIYRNDLTIVGYLFDVQKPDGTILQANVGLNGNKAFVDNNLVIFYSKTCPSGEGLYGYDPSKKRNSDCDNLIC